MIAFQQCKNRLKRSSYAKVMNGQSLGQTREKGKSQRSDLG
jgi:hypothetical protein